MAEVGGVSSERPAELGHRQRLGEPRWRPAESLRVDGDVEAAEREGEARGHDALDGREAVVAAEGREQSLSVQDGNELLLQHDLPAVASAELLDEGVRRCGLRDACSSPPSRAEEGRGKKGDQSSDQKPHIEVAPLEKRRRRSRTCC